MTWVRPHWEPKLNQWGNEKAMWHHATDHYEDVDIINIERKKK